ncbi:MAG: dihydroorotate oxidase [Patescibacteria group bacterium]
MNALLYNIYESYDENFKKGPLGSRNLKKPIFKKSNHSYKFLGFPINIPFGIPAGPLLNSKFIKEAFDFGFAVSTYKTVRTDSFPCHPYPNIVFLDSPNKFDPSKISRLKVRSGAKVSKNLTITNSFGVPSKDSRFWQKDVKRALACQKKGSLMILSFMGTVKKNQTQQEFIDDFAKAGKLAKQTQAKVLEANLSCPNIGNEGLVCYNQDVTKKVCQMVRKAIGNTPLILKIGYYKTYKDLEKLAEIANEYANAIAAINTIQAEIVGKNGNQALPGANRLKSGVCGYAIRWAGLKMVKMLNKIRQNKNYKFQIIGIGGVLTPDDYFEYKKSGADIVQSATGAMWNPYLAYEIWKREN